MALKVYLTAATGILNLQQDSEAVKSIPSQHVKYDSKGDGYYKIYNLTVKKGSGFMYSALWSDLQDSAGTALGVSEPLAKAALDALIGVQKTV
jgi:hypothetical protein